MPGPRSTRRRFCCGVAGSSFAIAGCLGSSDETDSHEHEDPPWEWGGAYELDGGTHTYTYQEGPDPEMRLVLLQIDDGTDHELFHAGETATELFEETADETVVTDGDAVTPSSETLYLVDFASSGPTSLDVEVDADGYYGVFTAHVPEEFDAELLTDGDEQTPDATAVHTDHDH